MGRVKGMESEKERERMYEGNRDVKSNKGGRERERGGCKG